MRRLKALVPVATVLVATGTGLLADQIGAPTIHKIVAEIASKQKDEPSGPVVYYRHPSGKPFYSLRPKTTDEGNPYIAVHASEEQTSSATQAPESSPVLRGEKKIKYYRNPMGLPDTSPTPKKDAM